MEYTNKNVPILCAECDAIAEGIEAMRDHITEDHPTIYTIEEAGLFAELWMDDAYSRIEEEERNATLFKRGGI